MLFRSEGEGLVPREVEEEIHDVNGIVSADVTNSVTAAFVLE